LRIEGEGFGRRLHAAAGSHQDLILKDFP